MKQLRHVLFIVFLQLSIILFLPISQTNGDGCTHQWIMIETVPATCDAEGYELFRCTLCGAEKRETIAALGHIWSYCSMVEKPTCTKDGLLRCYCARDQSHYYDTIEPALGHSWGEWRVTKRETLNEWGCSQRQCARCGEIEKSWTRPLAYRKPYSLTLILSPTSTDVKPQDDGSIALIQEVTLINTGENDLFIREYSIQEANERVLAEQIGLPTGQTSTFLLTCVLTEEELSPIVVSRATDGYLPLTLCFYGDTESEARVCVSNPVPWKPLLLSDPSAQPFSAYSPLRVTQTILSSSADSKGYQLSETLRCLICVTNEGDEPSPEVCLKTDLETDPLIVPPLAPGESMHLPWAHEITLPEAIMGYSYVAWQAFWKEEVGNIPLPEPSNAIVVPVITTLDLLVEVLPENDPISVSSFKPGDEICLQLRIRNNSAYLLSDITVFTSFSATGTDEPAAFLERLGAEEEHIIETRYSVTEQDVQAGVIRVMASARGFDLQGRLHECTSGEVSVPVTP